MVLLTPASALRAVRGAWGDLWRPGKLPELDGWRALAILWVLAFHALFFLKPYIGNEEMWALVTAPALRVVWEGDFGVDIFFVLSGLLIGDGLLRERTARGTIALRRFYMRRALRLLPAYYVVLGVTAYAHPINLERVWANLLYINNLLPFAQQFMGWSWSLAIEEQFYLLFPWVLLALFRLPERSRKALLVVAIGSSAVLAAAIAAHHDLNVFDAVMVPVQSPERWQLNFDTLYDKPWTRGGALAIGVLLAWHRLDGAPGPPRTVLWLLWLGAWAYALRLWPGAYELKGTAGHLYLGSHRVVFAIGTAAAMMLSLDATRGRNLLSTLARAPGTTAVARLAYGAYLLNPLVALGVWAWLEPRGWTRDAMPWRLIGGSLATVAATLASAFLLYALVERPVLRWRDRRVPHRLE